MATIGQQLKAAREAKGVNEVEAGLATKILTRLIVAMEADDFSVMAAPTYAKGFIRLYSRYLGIDPEPLVDEYMARHAPVSKPFGDEESQLRKNSQKNSQKGGPRGGNNGRFELNNDSFVWFKSIARRFATERPQGLKTDIRLPAIGVALLLVLIMLGVSISNCSRRRAADKPAAQPEETPAHRLLDEPLPDLYLVDPGKIEQK